MKNRRRFFLKIVILLFTLAILAFSSLTAILYWKQDNVVQELVSTVNIDFDGKLSIKDSHISPFENFPYISIDLEEVIVHESKDNEQQPILKLNDVYIGFDLWTLLGGSVDIQSIKLKEGFIKLIQHTDGSFNIVNALSTKKTIDDPSEEFHMHLKSIELVNVDLLKINEANNLILETFIDDASSRFKTSPDHIFVSLNSRFQLNVIVNGDTTFVKHKHFDLHTELDYLSKEQKLIIQPSEVKLESALLKMDGSIDFDDDMNLDINFHGNKPNFDLFMAFAPEELTPVLQRYDNAGKIFFEASIKGRSINGHNPLVVADFGCEDAFFDNKISKKRLDNLYFKGHFTTGEKRNASTMEFSLVDFTAKPEAGLFSGNLLVRNFESPEINMQIRSDFDLEFLSKFLNITDLQDLKGRVGLTMNFHDIIDLANPEKSIEKLNESYFTELEVENLSFSLNEYHLPVQDIDIKAKMDGHEADIENLSIKIGDSDISIQAQISDLPAILHHTNNPVSAILTVKSNFLNIKQLTSYDTVKSKPVDEAIRDLSLKLKFNSTAKAFTESPNLPIGEFFIENLNAQLTHYPHKLHDFHADVFVDDQDFRVVDFTGMIDKSDFHFTGKLKNYDLWFNEDPLGDTKVEFNLTSTLLQLEDLFSYGGENFVPEDYRHEEFRQLIVHGFADLHFNKGLKSSDIFIDRMETQMKVHPLRFEQFKGRFHYEDEHLVVENFSGKLGKSQFSINSHYYFGTDETIKKRDNHFGLTAPRLDFDELFNYNPPPASTQSKPEDHEAGFNIYDLPFTDMTFGIDIKHLNYHRFLLDDFFVKARTNKEHYIYVDTLSMLAAGGKINLHGYFNGADRNKIYFSPVMKLHKVDLDKLLLKFENFGQDHLVSENLHGKLSGNLYGKIHMHADLVPILDDSEIHMDIDVTEGRLEHYAALDAVSDYFKDKNLTRVLFDTLHNKLDMTNGVLSIPNMTINSSLGFIEISGKQDLDMNMEYYLRIPWKLVTRIGSQKLFGSDDQSAGDDEIQYKDDSKKVRYINLKISGTPDNYKISLGKDKNQYK